MNRAVRRTVPADGMNPEYLCASHATAAREAGEQLRTLDPRNESNMKCERCDPSARGHQS